MGESGKIPPDHCEQLNEPLQLIMFQAGNARTGGRDLSHRVAGKSSSESAKRVRREDGVTLTLESSTRKDVRKTSKLRTKGNGTYPRNHLDKQKRTTLGACISWGKHKNQSIQIATGGRIIHHHPQPKTKTKKTPHPRHGSTASGVRHERG